MDITYIIDKLPLLLTGLKLTFGISILCITLSLVFGLIGGVIRGLHVPILSPIVNIIVEFIRNTPLLVHLFFIYFGLPNLGVTVSPVLTGCIALSIWGGVYATENFRGGIEAVQNSLIEAASSLGLSKWHTIRYVIVPIGFRISFPSFSNTAISVLKNTSFLTGIGVAELTFVAMDRIAIDFKTFEMFTSIAILYLILVWMTTTIFGFIERKLDYNRGSKEKGGMIRFGDSIRKFTTSLKRAS